MISLIHPSRSRAEKSYQNSNEWLRVAGDMNIELLVSVDKDDSELQKYKSRYGLSQLVIGEHKSVVEATNHAAAMASGDILIYLSDDFKCPTYWATLVLDEFKKYSDTALIKVDDCLQPFHVPVLTIPIMNRALYERLGYFWYPEYKSMFVDEDLYWTAKKLGALKLCPHLKFPHEHVSIGKAENDETYRRSAANWDQGKALFAKRKAAGFPV